MTDIITPPSNHPATHTSSPASPSLSVVPTRSPQLYYQQLSEVSIELVTRELLASHITTESRGEILCSCPHHDSSSKKSLTITPAKQAWFCFGCGVGGGVLQLVEFVQSGKVTHGNDANGRRPESHRKARDYVAEKAGLPPLGSYGLSPAELTELEQSHFKANRALDCLTAAARFYHESFLNPEKPEPLSWWLKKTGLSPQTLVDQQIGYSNNYGLPEHLRKLGFTNDEILSTGLYREDEHGSITITTFEGRITCPYWSCGRVHYMIGRETPWTQKKEKALPKYKKLLAHNEQTCKFVSPAITNNRLHNEDILSTDISYVIITEGVTDNLSGIEHGFPCVSPVTVSIRNNDWPRLTPKFSRLKTVYLVGDNEVSQAGLEGSLRTAARLKQIGAVPRIVILPLRDDQRKAREIIAERWQITDHMNREQVTERKKNIPDDEINEYRSLTDLAKMDLNAYFCDGNTAEDLQALLDLAPTPTEFAIDRINVDAEDLFSEIDPILHGIAEAGALDRDVLASQVKDKVGGKISKKAIVDRIGEHRRADKKQIRVVTRQSTAAITAPDGTLKNLIQRHKAKALQNKQQLDVPPLAREMWQWFKDHGAVAISDLQNHIAVHYNSKLYYISPQSREAAFSWNAMLFDTADLLQRNPEDAKITEALKDVASYGINETKGGGSWLYTDHKKFTVYLDLNTKAGEIAKISPDGVEIMSNGNNPDGVFLQTTRHMKPINYQPDVDHESAFRHLRKMVDVFTCSERDKEMILSWLLCLLLLDFSSTKPVARFEGATESGKSTAGDMITCLIYGEVLQQKVTVAAAWALSGVSPILCLDNIEQDNQTTALKDFVLLAATGATNTKRKAGTDSDTIDERPHCIQISSGIDAWFAEFPEVTNRCFTFTFHEENQTASFVEHEVYDEIKSHRDEILSFFMQRTSQALGKLRDGHLGSTKQIIVEKFPKHNKKRANEFISLMAIMNTADEPDEPPSIPFAISQWLVHQTESALSVSSEASEIALGLGMLFGKCDFSDRLDETQQREEFSKRYLVKVSRDAQGRRQIGPANSADLFTAVSSVHRDHGMSFKINGVVSFGRRLVQNIETLRAAGFEITKMKGHGNKQFFTVVKLDESDYPLTPDDDVATKTHLEDAPF